MNSEGSCCFCCTLAQGTVGIGLFYTFGSLMKIVIGAYSIFNTPTGYHPTYLRNVIFGAFILWLNILLFVAVATRRRSYLIPWLCCMLIWLIFLIIFLFYNISTQVMHPVNVAVFGLTIGLLGYFYSVVFSYYKSLAPPIPHLPVALTMNSTTETSFIGPGYAVSYPSTNTEYFTVQTENYKNQPPSYPESVSNPVYVQIGNNEDDSLKPPPSYSECVKMENK